MAIKKKIKNIEWVRETYEKYNFEKHKRIFTKDPKIEANFLFRKVFNRDIDWESPKNLIEKYYWMLFNTDTSIWSFCADKYLVREYVNNCGCGDLLNELFGYWYNVDDIDFDKLPSQFVFKPNNACERIVIVKEKSLLNKQKTRGLLKKWLTPYGYVNSQIQYLKIKPCIIAEKLLRNSDLRNSLIDYKFLCYYGIPEMILIVNDRDEKNHSRYTLNLYDINWNPISDNLCNCDIGEIIPKPKSLNKMIEACHKLGKEFPCVRIDFYEVDEKPIFGEFTFTTGYGYYTSEYYDYLGSKIDLGKLRNINLT